HRRHRAARAHSHRIILRLLTLQMTAFHMGHLMRHLCLAVVCFLLFACEDILPVENVDLCEGDRPASADCTQCKATPIPQDCPQCRDGSPDPKCENAIPQGGTGATSGTGGKAGNTASTGGS